MCFCIYLVCNGEHAMLHNGTVSMAVHRLYAGVSTSAAHSCGVVQQTSLFIQIWSMCLRCSCLSCSCTQTPQTLSMARQLR